MVSARKGAAGEQLEEDRSQGMNVGRGRHGFAAAFGLLGGHVAGRRDDRARLGDRGGGALDALGQSEIRDEGNQLLEGRIGPPGKEDVGRLQVAVEDPALMDVVNGPCDRRHQPCRGARISLEALDLRGQVAAVDELHAEVVVAVVLTDFVDRHDVRVVEVRGGLGLEPEALKVVGSGEAAGTHHLERERAVQAHLAGLVDHSHTPLGDDLDQLVVAEIADARFTRGLFAGVDVRRAGLRIGRTCDVLVAQGGELGKSGGRGLGSGSAADERGCFPYDGRGKQTVHVVLVGEERSQLGRQVRMLCEKRGSIEGLVGFHGFKIGRDELIEAFIMVFRAIAERLGRVLGDGSHGICLSSGFHAVPQSLETAVEQSGDGRFGRAELESDLGEGPALQMMKLDGSALAFGQSRERLSHPEQFFVADRALAR